MADIGATLREARMRARIDISEVEAETKIRAKYLRALENEEWDLLPGSVFVKSFLKTYGDYLGLDSRLLIDEYKRRYERPSDHEPRATTAAVSARDRERLARDRRPSRSRWLTSPVFVLIVVIVLIGVALWVIGSHNTSPDNGVAGQTSQTQTTSDGTHHHKHHKPGQRAGTQTSKSQTKTTPANTQATLSIVPTGSIYMCLERPSGTVLVANTLAAGDSVPQYHGKELLVTFGTANADVKVNGKPYTLTYHGDPIALKITPAGAQPIAAGPTCT